MEIKYPTNGIGIGPYGPGGYQINLSLTTPKTTFDLSLAPLSWGLFFNAAQGNLTDFAMIQIGPVKFVAQRSLWNTD